MDEPLLLVAGIALVVVGAVGATITQRRLDAEGRSTLAPLWIAPFGVLLGAGAAMVRGWDLVASMVVGAVLIPLVGAVGRYLEVRRHRRAQGR